jgi:hypothetical protein
MRRLTVTAAGLVLAGVMLSAPAAAQQRKPLDTLADVKQAIRSCWRWPPINAIRSGMELTVRLSFTAAGDAGARRGHRRAAVLFPFCRYPQTTRGIAPWLVPKTRSRWKPPRAKW